MTMVSYAQNFEDVILQRALRFVGTGCYLDVGASLPDKDSVSYAFYQRGWRGICVEPQPYADEWKQLRPQDSFVNAAVGASPGEATLHVFDNIREISTASPARTGAKQAATLLSHTILDSALTDSGCRPHLTWPSLVRAHGR
jgi:hypothetical protein